MYKKVITTALFSFAVISVNAQIDSLKVNFDLRTRGELDNGARTLIPKGKSAETTVLSRARMGVDYYYKNLEIYFSVQDVRTWGENTSNASKNQNFILNEAWAKYQVSEKIGVKLGRQILSYDDERLVGGLDWAMQGRSFDALKGIFLLGKNSKLEAVVTYNNDDNDANDLEDKELYTIAEAGEITKSIQLLHYEYKNDSGFKFSAIGMNSVLQNPSGTHFDMLTLGVNLSKTIQNVRLFGSAYYQTGKNTAGQSKSAYQFSINGDVAWNQKIHSVIGSELLSGNSSNTSAANNRAFSPLYGTNHKFNGFMDYFYSGASYFNSFGLNDYYLKNSFTLSPQTSLDANVHLFTSNGKLGNGLSSYLGTEADLVFNAKIGKIITINLGQSLLFAGDGMKFVKNVSDPKGLQSWSWIGIKISPNFRLL
ncbi:alginate export family protein [Chryseobacterium sp.]|uniref:alginate export family protein n=1 Tax=Chryseobacterium sp. TaxID=1871047 RepID=UPI0025B85FF6|nr:alginate export family protein [Chryseobacterium sp.]